MPRSGMGKFLESLKSKFRSRKEAKAKPSFRQWAKANGHEVDQGSVGQLMQEFIAETKPGKAGVRAAVAGEFAVAVKASVPPSLDHAALDAVTAASAKAGSHEAIALRSALSMEPELPASLEADLDKVSALLDSGRQAEGVALLKSALAQIQTSLPEAKAATKLLDTASANPSAGSTLSASSGSPKPGLHSSFPAKGAGDAKLSAPSAKAATPAGQKPKTDGAIQLSDKPANTPDAHRNERARRLLADAGMPLKSLAGIWWSDDGEKSLRSAKDVLRREIEGAKSWRERQPLEDLILETLAGKHQPVDLFRRFKFLSDDAPNHRHILR